MKSQKSIKWDSLCNPDIKNAVTSMEIWQPVCNTLFAHLALPPPQLSPMVWTGVEMEGQHNVKPNTTYLFMANHVSLLDPPLLGGYIPGIVRGAEAHVQHRQLLYGWVMRRIGNITVERESIHKSVSSFRKVRQLLESGRSMIILLEGHRTLDGQT